MVRCLIEVVRTQLALFDLCGQTDSSTSLIKSVKFASNPNTSTGHDVVFQLDIQGSPMPQALWPLISNTSGDCWGAVGKFLKSLAHAQSKPTEDEGLMSVIDKVFLNQLNGLGYIWLHRTNCTRWVVSGVCRGAEEWSPFSSLSQSATEVQYEDISMTEFRTKVVLTHLHLCERYGLNKQVQSNDNFQQSSPRLDTSYEMKASHVIRVAKVKLEKTDGSTLDTNTQYLHSISNHLQQILLRRSEQPELSDALQAVQLELIVSTASKIHLLGTKYDVPITDRLQLTSLKGPFILYNIARCKALIDGLGSQPLLNIHDTDFDLLRDPVEWQLIKTLGQFEDLCFLIQPKSVQGKFCTHKVTDYVVRLSTMFSKYYSRVRILPSSSKTPKPRTYARLYLCMAYAIVAEDCLKLLGV